MSLIAELQRRNVFRVAVAYLAASWLLVEVLSTVFDVYRAPEWVLQILVALLAVGFPIVTVFSWAYEITPEGLKREKDVVRDESITHITAKRLDGITIGLIAFAVAFVLIDRLWLTTAHIESPSAVVTESASQPIPAREAAPENSIAVLPFNDMSPDKDQEYFADGLADTLIHVLAQVSGLKVIAKTSSFAFKGENKDVRHIADLLEVASVLEGSVQKAGSRVRVTAQLIDASDGTHIWSKSFDRDLENIFAIQDEIARDVVEELKVALLDSEEERLVQRYQPTLEVYEQLILGRLEMAKRTPDSLAAAEQHFKNAIDLDPHYALAYVHLSDTHNLQGEYSGLAENKTMELRQPLIEKALELDPLSGEAHTARANFRMHRGEHESAEEDFLKAIQLTPNYATAHHWYYILLKYQGRFEDALAQIRIAAKLDPMAPVIQSSLARAVWDMGRAEEALTLIRRSIKRNPELSGHYNTLGQFLWRLGRLGEAQWWLREGRKSDPDALTTWFYQCIGFLYLRDELAAEDCANQLSEAYPETRYSTFARLHLQFYRADWDGAAATQESRLERVAERNRKYAMSSLAYAIASQGEFERARRLMAEAFPELLEDELEVSATDVYQARFFAAILHCTGETDHRDALLSAVEHRIATMHRNRGAGYGATDVYVHAMRGDRDRAVAALREALDTGVYFTRPRWTLSRDFLLKREGLLDDPEFTALLNELHADVAIQRRWYEENKDKPLL